MRARSTHGSRRRTVAVLAAVILALAAPATAQETDLAAAFDAYVRQAVADWEVPGLAVSVVHGGEVVLSRGYGVREIGGSGAVDSQTLFAIGSTTKAMTAAAIGMLVDEGKLSWDSKVEDLLPGFRLADPWVSRELTVRDLLTHRAGLGNADFLWYRSGRESADVLARARFIDPAYSMRAGFVYQNIMYATAGAVIETVSGMPWSEFVQTRIFAPLGMERTEPLHAGARTRDNVATPHDRIDGEIVTIENAPVDAVAAAGSVWSSAGDMARWLLFMLQGGELGGRRLLEAETAAELLRPQVIVPADAFYPTAELTRPHWTTYAMGWFQHDYDGRAVSFHTGSIDGMVAIAGMIPDEGLGVYVLANLDHAELRHALMYRAFDLWGGVADGRDWSADLQKLYGDIQARARESLVAAEESRVPDTTPSLPLEAYAGTYVDPLYGQVEVALEDGSLRLRAGELKATLEHWHYDTFRGAWSRRWMGTTLATFHLDARGRVASLQLLGRTFRRRLED